jgi:hypothetical protein
MGISRLHTSTAEYTAYSTVIQETRELHLVGQWIINM